MSLSIPEFSIGPPWRNRQVWNLEPQIRWLQQAISSLLSLSLAMNDTSYQVNLDATPCGSRVTWGKSFSSLAAKRHQVQI